MTEKKVHLFKKVEGKNQEGYVFYPDDKTIFKDCIIVYSENENILEEGDYSFDDFKEVALMADIVHPDDPIPLSKANGKMLLIVKN